MSMKDVLVIDYTELDWPWLGIKTNEGHAIYELVKRSGLDHLVISTGFMHNRYDCCPYSKNRVWFDQSANPRYPGKAQVICPGLKDHQESFDFEKNWFKPGFLESKLSEYCYIILNLHSLDPRHVKMYESFEELDRSRIKVNFNLYTPRLTRLYSDAKISDFEKVFKLADNCTFFFDPRFASFEVPQGKANRIHTGVDEKAYDLSGPQGKGLQIVSSINYDERITYPYQLCSIAAYVTHNK